VDSVVGAPVTGMWNGTAATISEAYRAGGVGIEGELFIIAGDKLQCTVLSVQGDCGNSATMGRLCF